MNQTLMIIVPDIATEYKEDRQNSLIQQCLGQKYMHQNDYKIK